MEGIIDGMAQIFAWKRAVVDVVVVVDGGRFEKVAYLKSHRYVNRTSLVLHVWFRFLTGRP